jgi:hypothetical protein
MKKPYFLGQTLLPNFFFVLVHKIRTQYMAAYFINTLYMIVDFREVGCEDAADSGADLWT